VSLRIKDCQSIVNALRRRQEGAVFNGDKPELYTLNKLRDLAGVRISVFPRRLWQEIHVEVRKRLLDWESDPIRDDNGELLAFKYHGFCEASDKVGVNARLSRC
jgi:hypothetical protein